MAEPAGTVLGLLAVGISPRLNAAFLSFAAGAMLFVSVHELVPLARRRRQLRLFIAGIASSALVYAVLASLTVGRIVRALP